MLRYWTAGESHGKALLALIDGFPAGLQINTDLIDEDLKLRQGGYGRGKRQQLETDKVDILTGIWKGETLGSPLALQVINRDYKLERLKDLERPRPGHGDMTGAVKYLGSIRGVLERASARETAVRVAAGSLAKQLLQAFGVEVLGYVAELGGVKIDTPEGTLADHRRARTESIVYTLDPSRDESMRALIDQTGQRWRYAGRRLRGACGRIAVRARNARSVGSQTRWTFGAGGDGGASHQGCGDWARVRGGTSTGQPSS